MPISADHYDWLLQLDSAVFPTAAPTWPAAPAAPAAPPNAPNAPNAPAIPSPTPAPTPPPPPPPPPLSLPDLHQWYSLAPELCLVYPGFGVCALVALSHQQWLQWISGNITREAQLTCRSFNSNYNKRDDSYEHLLYLHVYHMSKTNAWDNKRYMSMGRVVISDIRNHLIPLLSARFYNTSTATTTTTTTITPSFHWAGLSGLTVSESGFRLFKSTFACTQAPTNNLNHPNTTTTTINKDFILVNKRTGQRRIIEYPISVLDDNDLLVESFRRIVSPCVCLALFKQQQQEEEKKGVYTTRPLLECSQPDVCYISNHEQQQQQQQQDFVGHDHLHECCWQVDSTIRLMINTNPSSLLL